MWYIDTSAAVKLVVDEDHADAMRSWAAGHADELATADLLRTELIRAVRRHRPARLQRAHEVLDSIALMALPTALFRDAAQIDPVELRSLDALHLAAARHLGDDLEGIVVYDTRLIEAARGYGIAVVTPGADE